MYGHKFRPVRSPDMEGAFYSRNLGQSLNHPMAAGPKFGRTSIKNQQNTHDNLGA